MTFGDAQCSLVSSKEVQPGQTTIDNIDPIASETMYHEPSDNIDDRGRSLEREPRFANPLSRAESRRRNVSIEVDARTIERTQTASRSSTFFDDPTHPSAILDDDLLEPCPHLPICDNVSEVLTGDDTSRRSSIVVNRLRRAVSSSVDDGSTREPKVNPTRALTTVFRGCKSFSLAPTVPPEARSLANIGQLENLAIKSSSFSPKKRRRNVRVKPSAGSKLPAEIIQQILSHLPPIDFNAARHICRSWYISSLDRSLLETMFIRGGWATSIQHDISDNLNTTSIEWFMSRRLARECAFVADCKSPFVQASTVDFTEVAVHYPGSNTAGTIFTVSSCGRFLMAANGCLIYIYEINRTRHFTDELPGSLRPVTSIICPNRVAACSMDTSSQRYAVAILLDGRMGLVCEIGNITPDLRRDTMPIETGSRSLYRNLCSEDDPPRSVAICPQRRCVAFGCSAGIELHWVDALTGQDLNRWFPLTAPSDYLYFLPPRKSVDSAKKLRLISSSAKPAERAAISNKSFGSGRNSTFWNRNDDAEVPSLLSRVRGDASNRIFNGKMMDISDHYRAIPLSDGYHILFVDPATDVLCLGIDAPVGGPTKLLRQIWFEGPKGKGSPVAYAGGSDLSWGIKVAAVYGTGAEQSIWFFSVPVDVLTTVADVVQPPNFGSKFSTTERLNTEWKNWWPDDGLQDRLKDTDQPFAFLTPQSDWPLKIRGKKIGTCSGLVDIAVDSGPAMSVWAFEKDGFAQTWKIDDRIPAFWQRVIRDGTIRESDEDDDIEMLTESSLPAARLPGVTYDKDGDVVMEDGSSS